MKRFGRFALLTFPLMLWAGDLDDVLDDFADTSFQIEQNLTQDREVKAENPSWYTLHGYINFLSAYNYTQSDNSSVASGDTAMDFSGLSRAKLKGGLTLEMKHGKNWHSKLEVMAWYDAAWALKGRTHYSDALLDDYERFYDIKDAYVQGALSSDLDLKVGRQIVIWGKSDSIRITDVINPLDNREPGMTDIEDLRLTETMVKLDYYLNQWQLSLIAIPEPRLQIKPTFGSDYRPANLFGAPLPTANFPDRSTLDWNSANMQYASSLDGRFKGWDLSFYAAHVLSDRFGIEKVGTTPFRNYSLIDMQGLATNIVMGSWLLKTEAAYLHGIDYRSTDKKDRLDLLIGFDYNGLKDTLISLELANRHIINFESRMLSLTLADAAASGTFPDFVREDTMQLAFRSSYDFNHDNATVSYLAMLFGGTGANANLDTQSLDGGLQRLWLTYKYSDTINLEAGIVDYFGTKDALLPFYKALENNDRAYAQIEYKF